MILTQAGLSTKLEVTAVVFFLACYTIVSSFLQYRHFPVHRGAVAVIIGLMGGIILRLSSVQTYREITKMDQTLIFLVLLPAIMFTKGYTFKKGAFLKNLPSITYFGILGTFISFLTISSLIYAANQLNLVRDSKDITNYRNLSIWQIILLSACLCSIDTVSAQQTIQQNIYPKLNSIVVGQDIFKDCVTIVLFRAILRLENMETPSKFVFFWYTPFQILGNFFMLVSGSVLLSLGTAFGTTYLFKKFRFLLNDNGVSETSALFLLGFTTYLLAQCFTLSGIISVLCYGVLLNKYNYFNLSQNGQTTSKNTFLFVSNVCQGLVFLIIGIMAWQVQWKDETPPNSMTHSYIFVLVVMIILVIGRIVNVYVLWGLGRLVSLAIRKINRDEIFVVFVSGLARGATPFALFTSVEFLDSGSGYAKREGLVLKTTIIIVVLFCTVILNSLIPTIFKKPLKNLRKQAKQYLQYKSHEDPKEHHLKKLAKSHFRKFEQQKLKPTLIFDYQRRKIEIQEIIQNQKKHQLDEALLALEEGQENQQESCEVLKESLVSN